MAKSPDAFRTISEVAEWLGIQAHVLRFWESKFTQVKPVKRAGGRRYYRPGDMLLLGGIKKLLYEDGLTIKGVQKILREEGMTHVADMSGPLDELTLSEIGGKAPVPEAPLVQMAQPEEEPRGVVLKFGSATTETESKEAPQATETKADTVDDDILESVTPDALEDDTSATLSETASPAGDDTSNNMQKTKTEPKEKTEPEPEQEILPEAPATIAAASPDKTPEIAAQNDTSIAEGILAAESPVNAETATEIDDPLPSAPDGAPMDVAPANAGQIAEADGKPENDTAAALPAFMRRPALQDTNATRNEAPAPKQEAEPEEAAPKDAPVVKEQSPEPAPIKLKPRNIDIPPLTPEAEIVATPALLTSVYRTRHIDKATAATIAPLLDRLTAHHDSMAARRNGAGALAPKT